jgi:transposase-like protein
MQHNTAEPMEPSYQFCPNVACSARSQIGQGNITIHDRKRQRYRCRTCGRTFSIRRGTMFEGLRTSTKLVVIVVTFITFGCPIQAIVQAYGLDERTIASWRDRASQQCERVHHTLLEQGQLEVVHVQADEIRVKARGMVVWMGLALMISSRLWLAGVVSQTRDTHLADRLLLQVRACCRAGSNLLVCTEGGLLTLLVSSERCLIHTCPNGHKDALGKSVEHFHRLVWLYLHWRSG